MKCKPYSEITVEIGTQLKTVKITSNIFAVHIGLHSENLALFEGPNLEGCVILRSHNCVSSGPIRSMNSKYRER